MDVSEILNERYSNTQIHFTIFRYEINKFKSFGNVENKFRKKCRVWVKNEVIETDLSLSVVENPKYHL